MIYLHCAPVDQIDFRSMLQADAVRLLVPRVTFKELDKHKSSHANSRIRDRARKVLTYLEEMIGSGGEIREGVTLRFLPRMPDLDFHQYGLNESWNDDLLIASALECKLSDIERETFLITHDTGARLTCRHLEIRTLELPDKYRLPAELDENEKENQRLRRELQQLKNALPKISVGFSNGSEQTAHFEIQAPEAENENGIADRLRQLKEMNPPMTRPTESDQPETTSALLSRFSGPRLLAGAVSDAEYSRYNRELEHYLTQYEKYLRDLLAARNRSKRTIEFALSVSNTGSAPAEDVDVHFHFPDGFTLFVEEKRPRFPVEPSPPPKPRNAIEMMRADLPDIDGLMLRPNLPDIGGSLSNFDLRRTNSYDLTDHFRRIKHGFVETLPDLCLIFDRFDDARSFHCDYEISVGNLPSPVTGQLNFVIAKGNSTTRQQSG